ncbi:hypothetical protein OH791_39010 (plasmid) [Streptomyces anulatus]|uniref:hypothetical protein n=1 Tax=Streptomyces anulatus TaxID=1892 RepID=UPI002F90FFBD|nr:hypothetical protein OH791_39010 [Streptomyces anulatus]
MGRRRRPGLRPAPGGRPPTRAAEWFRDVDTTKFALEYVTTVIELCIDRRDAQQSRAWAQQSAGYHRTPPAQGRGGPSVGRR